MKLTDNQQKVFEAISEECNTAKSIAEKIGSTAQSVNSTLTALEKKELITKNKDKTVSRIAGESQTPDPGSPVSDPQSPVPVLIPYLKSQAAGDELKYALRSFEANLQTDIQVIVIGDREDWFNEENITHIPVDVHSLTVEGKEKTDPQADVANKILTAIASLELSGEFILTYDDVFILGQTEKYELLPYAFGELSKAGSTNSEYRRKAEKTAEILQKKGLKTIRYDAHTPVILDAESISAIISEHKALERGLLIKSLYFNTHRPDYRPVQVNGGLHDPVLASIYRADPQLGPLHDAVKNRKFMNCNTAGWKAVYPIMKSLFPEKSKFEK